MLMPGGGKSYGVREDKLSDLAAKVATERPAIVVTRNRKLVWGNLEEAGATAVDGKVPTYVLDTEDDDPMLASLRQEIIKIAGDDGMNPDL